MPYSGFLPNTTLPHPTLIKAPPRAPQSELLNYSNTPQFSTQAINFANTDKISTSELPQPIRTVSNINDTTHDISLLSDTSNPDPISSQFSSPTASQIANNTFDPQQILNAGYHKQLGITFLTLSIHQLFFKAHYHSEFSTPPIITLSSNSPTPDTDQYSHHSIGKQPEKKQTYPTLPLKSDPKFIVPQPPSWDTIITVNNYIIGQNKESLHLLSFSC